MWVLSVKCYDGNDDSKCAWHGSPSSTSQEHLQVGALLCMCTERTISLVTSPPGKGRHQAPVGHHCE